MGGTSFSDSFPGADTPGYEPGVGSRLMKTCVLQKARSWDDGVADKFKNTTYDEIFEGKKVSSRRQKPAPLHPHARAEAEAASPYAGHRVCRARGLHGRVPQRACSLIQQERGCIQGQGSGQRHLRVGQRSLHHECLEENPGRIRGGHRILRRLKWLLHPLHGQLHILFTILSLPSLHLSLPLVPFLISPCLRLPR